MSAPSRARRRLAAVGAASVALSLAALPTATAIGPLDDLLGDTTDAVEDAFAPQLVTVQAETREPGPAPSPPGTPGRSRSASRPPSKPTGASAGT